jgi:pentatricopeptide repeat domain-containing protein 1
LELIDIVKDRSASVEAVAASIDELDAHCLLSSPQDCTVVLAALARRKMKGRALELLDTMCRHDGPEPNLIHFNAVLSAFEVAADTEGAMALFERMRDHGLVPDTVSYNTAMSACAKAGKWRMAIDLLCQMMPAAVAPNVVSFSAAIDACARVGEWEKALDLLGCMQSLGVYPNNVTMNSVIGAQPQPRRHRLPSCPSMIRDVSQ